MRDPRCGPTVGVVGRLLVNGGERAVELVAGRTLLEVLREDLGLTGAKYGCGTGGCGACTVLVDGKAERACVLDCSMVDGAAVTTVEGLSADGSLHAVQAAFVAARSLQCGYCTPGMVMSAVALLGREPEPDEAAVRGALEGNICRCGGYPRILSAVHDASTAGRLAVEVPETPEVGVPEGTVDAWTVVLPPVDGVRRGRGWSTPGGARLVIDGRGRVTGFTGKVDGGQGNRAELTRLIAAELGVSTAAVRLEMGDTASAPLDLGTVGSRSTPDAGHVLRLVAVTARRELLAAAASRWRVDPGELTVAGGMVSAADGREISFADLVAGGSRTVLADPDEPIPPAPDGLADVDTTELRRHLVAAVTGAKRFPSDLVLPDMLYGQVLRGPGHGAVLRTADTSAARRLPGVIVVADGDFVGVAAPTPTAADQAMRAIRAEWDTTQQPSEAELEKYLRAHPIDIEGMGGAAHREAGDVGAAQAQAEICLAATYTTAYIAHVPLEPRVALARADQEAGQETVTVWTGTQRPFGVRDQVAEALGLPADRVRIVVPDFGGGFGGKHSGDVAIEAARLARAAGRPVKVAWTRAEEFQWAYLRPAAVIDVCGTATRSGELTSWEFTNINSGAAGLFSPYDIPNKRERFQPADSPLPRGSYRALAATANHFARESHLDELAAAVGVDPVDLRRRHLSDPRLAQVLDTVAERAGWAHRRRGSGMGIACGVEKEMRVATVAEVAVDPHGSPRVRRILTAVDCGAVVDPDGLRLQVTGATIMGLGGALFEAIHFDAGRILNASLADYRVPRFSDVPPIDVIVIDHPDLPSAGAGETPIVTVAPAIANAIHAATGRRLRAMPLTAAPHIR